VFLRKSEEREKLVPEAGKSSGFGLWNYRIRAPFPAAEAPGLPTQASGYGPGMTARHESLALSGGPHIVVAHQ
jgi:hypothetical protein